ncbi:PREDICTED: uncharacterized protein LOC104728797 [Camelina sativa]|uniref:Uncharacterized protein LOC104728797 n=1 Tax=Camelina sativa TaxID=90675 RepID=A0ABM0UTD3_CAMSA|nr:PREDICTED: uncharacterized protein LOC104728797 [Camelina sativa]
MKQQQTIVVFFLLALISTLSFRPSEARNTNLCFTTAIDNVPGCFYAVKLVADGDFRWISRECCDAVRTLPDTCYLEVVFGKCSYFISLNMSHWMFLGPLLRLTSQVHLVNFFGLKANNIKLSIAIHSTLCRLSTSAGGARS